jgi:hypothetical protein
MFGNVDGTMLGVFKDKRVRVFIGTQGSDKTIILEGVMTDYKLVGAFWVLDDKIFIPTTSVLYIELI